VQRIADMVDRHYGLSLNVQLTPGPGIAPMTTKLTEEMKANRRASSDIVVGYGSHMAKLSQVEVLTPVDWRSWTPHIRSAELIARGGEAVTVQTSYTGIIHNTQGVPGNCGVHFLCRAGMARSTSMGSILHGGCRCSPRSCMPSSACSLTSLWSDARAARPGTSNCSPYATKCGSCGAARSASPGARATDWSSLP
jgi:hypothetical protein